MVTGTPVMRTGTCGAGTESPEMGTGTHGVKTGILRDGNSTSRAGMGIIRVGVEPLVCRQDVQGGDRILCSWDSRDLQQRDGIPRDGDRHPLGGDGGLPGWEWDIHAGDGDPQGDRDAQGGDRNPHSGDGTFRVGTGSLQVEMGA